MKLNRTKLMLQYCVLQGSYWASFCVLYAFATVFLLSRGFESSMIGVIIAVGNILGVILQPVVASIADRSEKISLHKLTAFLSVIMIVLIAFLYMIPNILLAVAVLFLLTDTFLQVIQPLINSVSVYYVNQGVSVDFGAARGIGSLSYAAASYILGIAVERFGIEKYSDGGNAGSFDYADDGSLHASPLLFCRFAVKTNTAEAE